MRANQACTVPLGQPPAATARRASHVLALRRRTSSESRAPLGHTVSSGRCRVCLVPPGDTELLSALVRAVAVALRVTLAPSGLGTPHQWPVPRDSSATRVQPPAPIALLGGMVDPELSIARAAPAPAVRDTTAPHGPPLPHSHPQPARRVGTARQALGRAPTALPAPLAPAPPWFLPRARARARRARTAPQAPPARLQTPALRGRTAPRAPARPPLVPQASTACRGRPCAHSATRGGTGTRPLPRCPPCAVGPVWRGTTAHRAPPTPPPRCALQVSTACRAWAPRCPVRWVCTAAPAPCPPPSAAARAPQGISVLVARWTPFLVATPPCSVPRAPRGPSQWSWVTTVTS